MKKGILLVVMLMFCNLTNAQIIENNLNSRVESLEKLTKELNDKSHFLHSNLNNYQNQRKIGIAFMALGFVASSTAFTILSANKEHYQTNSTSAINALAIAGGISMSGGFVILLDSGKWLTFNKRKNGNYIDIEFSK